MCIPYRAFCGDVRASLALGMASYVVYRRVLIRDHRLSPQSSSDPDDLSYGSVHDLLSSASF